jgi:hypothetical protein
VGHWWRRIVAAMTWKWSWEGLDSVILCSPLDTNKIGMLDVSLNLTFILGFAASSVNPLTVADAVTSFCSAVFCKNIPILEAAIEVFGGRREMLSHCPLVMMINDSTSTVRWFHSCPRNGVDLNLVFGFPEDPVWDAGLWNPLS